MAMTRVTQSMLSNNMLRNLNTSYGQMSKLQDQINSGKLITRASDDPVIAVKGMAYRTDLGKIEQFQRNVNEVHTWLDTTDEALGQVGDALNRIKELIVQASNDTNTADDRAKIKVEIDQIQEQMRDVGNTKVGGKSVFAGTNTQQQLFTDVTYYKPEAVKEYYDGLYDETLTPPNSAQQTFLANYTPEVLDSITPPLEKVTGRMLNTEYTDVNGNVVNPLQAIGEVSVVVSDVTLTTPNTGQTAGMPSINIGLPDMDGVITTTTTTVTDTEIIVQTVLTKQLSTAPSVSELGITKGNEEVRMEVFDGVSLNVNAPGAAIFGEIDEMMTKISDILDPENGLGHDEIQALLGGIADKEDGKSTLSTLQSTVLSARADVGARQNRIEVIENRLSMAEVTVTKHMSQNEDTDYAKAITEMTTAESIHQAALSVGAKIIQQTLVDFMR